MPLEHACGDGVDGCAVGDVADLELAAGLLGERAEAVLAAREQDAAPAAAGEAAGELGADSGGGAGHDGDARLAHLHETTTRCAEPV